MTISNNLKGKICLVTGSTSGLGKATATAFCQLGATTILVGRNPKAGQQTKQEIIEKTHNSAVEFLLCDLSSQASIYQLVDQFHQKYQALHILVNNVGVWETQRQESIDQIEMMFATNHLASFLLTHLLLDTIKASQPARIINVSSHLHQRGSINFEDLEGKRDYNYRQLYFQSKLANILFTQELSKRLANTQVTVNSLSPGSVATNLSRNLPPPLRFVTKIIFDSPEKAAKKVVHLATYPQVESITGKYFVKNKIESPSEEARNETIAKQLWEISKSYTKIK